MSSSDKEEEEVRGNAKKNGTKCKIITNKYDRGELAEEEEETSQPPQQMQDEEESSLTDSIDAKGRSAMFSDCSSVPHL